MKEIKQAGDQIELGLQKVSNALRSLGTGNAGSDMGAIEYLATQVKEGCSEVAESIKELAAAVRGDHK